MNDRQRIALRNSLENLEIQIKALEEDQDFSDNIDYDLYDELIEERDEISKLLEDDPHLETHYRELGVEPEWWDFDEIITL